MYVVKKINHNAVLIDDAGLEKVAMGKGIGFSAIVGSPFDGTLADKIFTLDSKEKTRMFSEMASQIPLEYIEFAEEMIQDIIAAINQPLDTNIYIALTDHIYFAIQRQKENSQVTAIMLPEMKLLYPDEFQAATDVVKKINTQYQTLLGDNEVGFITMHIINAELGERNSLNGLRILEITKMVLQMIENEYAIQLDTDSLAYNRLLIHLKFLAKRMIYQEITTDETFEFLDQTFKESRHYLIAEKITKAIENQYHMHVLENEIAYLAIHLGRIQS